MFSETSYLHFFVFMTLLSAATFATKNSESHFIIQPASLSVIEGETVVFKCLASSVNDDLEYSWIFNGFPVVFNEFIQLHKSDLHIKNVNKTLSGDYVCIAKFSSTNARESSRTAHLNVVWITNATVQYQTLEKRKDVVVLKCQVDSSDDIKIEWFKDDELLKKTLNIEFRKNKLFIRDVTDKDDGNYSCSAENDAGFVFSNNKYELKSGSSKDSVYCSYAGSNKNGVFLCRGKRGDKHSNDRALKAHIQNETAYKFDKFSLACEISGKNSDGTENKLTVKWKRNGTNLLETVTINREAEFKPSGRLYINRRNGNLIFNTTRIEDAGFYECHVNNGEELVISNKAELKLISNLKFLPQPTSKNLELGSIGKIHCKAHGIPSVKEIHWTAENLTDLPESIEDINGTLTFKNVSLENNGNYICFASNSETTINSTVTVTAVISPKFLVQPEGPMEAVEMGTFAVHCQAIGLPKPNIQWDKDLQYLNINSNNSEESRFQFLENGTLLITEVHFEDEGRYGCTIGNSAGLKREEILLTVRSADGGYIPEENADGFMMTRAVLITMSVACAYIIFVIGLMLWCRYRRQSRKNRLNLLGKENGEIDENGGENKNDENEPCLPTKLNKKINNEPNGDAAHKSDGSANSKNSKKSTNFDGVSIPKSNLTLVCLLGRGDFGDVSVMKMKKCDEEKLRNNDEKVKLTTTNEKNISMEEMNEIKSENSMETEENFRFVLVKSLKKIKDENNSIEFRRQLDLFKGVSHKNVSKFYGISKDDGPHAMVLGWTDWGDLKQFLLATANGITQTHTGSTSGTRPPPLKIPQILAVAHQIGSGMDAIYRSRFIHKDLAARNCVISSNFTVKVTYPALCKDKYKMEYFKHRNQLLPIRWMAPECLDEDDFTIKNDVFAFSIVVWELFTQALKIPFEDMTNEEYLNKVQNSTLEWKVAENTPEELKTILQNCWNKNPKERPSFSQLLTAIGNCLQSEYPKDPIES